MNFPKLEEEVLERWKKEKAFEKSVQRRKRSPRFVFYEGPPTANGKPGIHHVLSRSFKDVILRYKTMRGFFVERRAGWDTHGLPVELQIEKKLGLKSKKDIEKYGIAQFNKECKQSVWEYKKEWEALTERMGFWIDLQNPYITYETSYIETLWFIIKQFWQRGLLYKGYKVVPYCPRCETPLSSHEMAQGYKTVEDTSIYVKFELKPGQKIGDWVTDNATYILSWTTTPWTLPGNVALAVGEEAQYVRAKVDKSDSDNFVPGETYIFAGDVKEGNVFDSPFIVGEDDKANVFLENSSGRKAWIHFMGVEPIEGKNLIGLKYEPLFDISALQNDKSHKIYAADFVKITEGTGVVHTAVMYGEDDYQLGTKVGLPQHHTVDESGNFTKDVSGFAGLPVKTKETEEKIFAHLKKKGYFLKTELYTHEYPFCWRCSTALLYYAKDSWFVDMQKVKQALLVNNKKVNWVPSHLKEGRMGEWLREVKDWAFSRERYWGTPLPIWECKKCEHREVVGSLEGLKEKTRSRNTYYMLRHGHSERQVKDIMSCWPEQKPLPLIKKGVQEIERVSKGLKKKKIDIILSSDLLRSRQTAEIVGKELGVTPLFDGRLREVNVGPELHGKHITELGKVWGKEGETSFEHYMRRFVEPLPGGESWLDVQKRMRELMQDLEKKYHNKTVLLVSHELPLTMVEGLGQGRSRKDIVDQRMKKVIDTGELRNLPFFSLPLNEDMELDLHRPYIDDIQFRCSACNTGNMQRVREVADVWYDSGAMPFAQAHWPFAKNSKFEIRNSKLTPPADFPADYIVEAIDQTRGWFYTLLAVSTLLGFKAPFRNVICLSHVLDEKGEKMSKSKGNVVDPWDMIKKYGIDAVRWYFFTMNNPADPKLFSAKDIQEVLRKFILILWNSFMFYQTYVPKPRLGLPKRGLGRNALDRWILSRLSTTTKEVTALLDAYDVTGAGRSLENFVINDLSLWYIRRSRTRFQNPTSAKDFREASATLSFVLLQVSKLAAPFIPFLSEYIYGLLQTKGSVHWEDYPKPEKQWINERIEKQMQAVRDIVAKALGERAKAGIKVRQPLALLKIQNPTLRLRSGRESKIQNTLIELLKDEVNVKKVVFDKNLKAEVELNTTLTPELREEGLVREILRSIQEMRKEAGYKPGEKAVLYYEGKGELANILEVYQDLIAKSSSIQKFVERKVLNLDKEKQVSIENSSLWFGIKKL